MNVYEQEWNATERADVVDAEGVIVGVAFGAHPRRGERARIFAAAQDMARELHHLVRLLEPLEKDGGLEVPGLATLNGARAALRKAGVLP